MIHTKNGTPELAKKHDSRGNLEVLTDLEITCKSDGLVNNVMAPHGKLRTVRNSKQ